MKIPRINITFNYTNLFFCLISPIFRYTNRKSQCMRLSN